MQAEKNAWCAQEVDMNAIIDAQNCESERRATKEGRARLTIVPESKVRQLCAKLAEQGMDFFDAYQLFDSGVITDEDGVVIARAIPRRV